MSFLYLFGKGTKISKYLVDHDKIYEVTIKLGIKTDTGDREGNIKEERQVDLSNLDEEHVREVLKTFIGRQKQKPPMYSAIKVKREKAI